MMYRWAVTLDTREAIESMEEQKRECWVRLFQEIGKYALPQQTYEIKTTEILGQIDDDLWSYVSEASVTEKW